MGGFNFTKASALISSAQQISSLRKQGFHKILGVHTVAEDKLADLSMDFAVMILKFVDTLKTHYSLKNQLERSATSIGANIREAKYAHSRPDFISKLQIALKECYETEYWLELLQRASLADEETIAALRHACGSLRRILISSINTAKMNQSEVGGKKYDNC